MQKKGLTQMDETNLSASDIELIRARGITRESVLRQIDLCRLGGTAVTLHRPATVGDGILRISDGEQDNLIALHNEAAGKGRCLKFVPASGAATRMFKDWYSIFLRGGFKNREEFESFAKELPRYAFYGELSAVLSAAGRDLEDFIARGRGEEILDFILTEKGLNYGGKPKALLKFHKYGDAVRTALEEHLVEAALYVRSGSGLCRIHFTVSKEHLDPVRELLQRSTGLYEKRFGVRFNIGLSIQSESTDTITVDFENRPHRDRSGRLLFRPGGHGALLYNLDRMDGDIVFIKNIDNVVPDRLRDTTVLYKKVIGGCLVLLQSELFGHLEALSDPDAGEPAIGAAKRFAADRLQRDLPSGLAGRPLDEQRQVLIDQLNRPIRVCGMVKNEGEPGGGPFWVTGKDGGCSLQIVEEVQVDKAKGNQAAIWASSTHFNPVDLVCGIRDFRGRKFDLGQFVDHEQVFVSTKSHEGCDIKALELPGLWNGSMAFWHTIFVEVPIETFTPVKTVEDLLRPVHQP
ncbi:MAG TPA: DUF4301 family protein [Syntrophales bacterium]|nr:DUF4301 family protein [Syntrophales bacterium]